MAKPKKKKEKKNIVSGIVHVNSTFNNTLITISDDQGNVAVSYTHLTLPTIYSV